MSAPEASMQIPSSGEIAGFLSAVGIAISGALVMWVRQSKAKLDVRQNDSQGSHLSRMEAALAKAQQLTEVAQQKTDEAVLRERETWSLWKEALQENASLHLRISMLTEKMERLEKRLLFVTELLVHERPDLSLLVNSAFGELHEVFHPLKPDEPKEKP